MFPFGSITTLPAVAILAALSLMEQHQAICPLGRYFEGRTVPNVKLGAALAVPTTFGNVNVTTFPTLVSFQTAAVVIAPVQAALAAVYSS